MTLEQWPFQITCVVVEAFASDEFEWIAFDHSILWVPCSRTLWVFDNTTLARRDVKSLLSSLPSLCSTVGLYLVVDRNRLMTIIFDGLKCLIVIMMV